MTITGVTLTLGLTSGGTVSRDFAATEAFANVAVPANGSQESRQLSVTTPSVQAYKLTARIGYTDANGRTGSVPATTNIVPIG